jgi:FtsP/CotA-like multicopper oxidase with cupredoxin domain
VTAPIGPIKGGGSCNSAGDRSKWCNGLSISDDYYTNGYSTGQVCAYDLTITNTTIDFDGSGPKVAFAINGQVPGPLIECNWGDTLHVTVHNKLTANSTSIHWHGMSCS